MDAGGTAYFAVDIGHVPAAGDGGAVPAGLRELGARLGDRDAGLLVLAVGLSNWHATHVRCPRCGEPTGVEMAGFVRRCTADGSEHYPRTDPAVIMLVTDADGGAGLLGSSPRWPGQRFSTLAGFVEPGESAEAAVLREVAEESGVLVERRDVHGQPAVAVPVVADARVHGQGDAGSPDPRRRRDELDDVRWFSREGLTEQIGSGSVRIPPADLDRAAPHRALVRRRAAARSRPPLVARAGALSRTAARGPGRRSGWSARCRPGRPASARSGCRR